MKTLQWRTWNQLLLQHWISLSMWIGKEIIAGRNTILFASGKLEFRILGQREEQQRPAENALQVTLELVRIFLCRSKKERKKENVHECVCVCVCSELIVISAMSVFELATFALLRAVVLILHSARPLSKVGSDKNTLNTADNLTSILQNFLPTGNKCFRVFFRRENEGEKWQDAVQKCQDGPGRNPNIASAHSEVEMGKMLEGMGRIFLAM